MSDDARTPGSPPCPNDPNDRLLDAAIHALAGSEPSAEESAAARRRTWDRIQAALASPDCAGIVADLDAWRAGELPEGRAALVRDHLGECLSCRRASRHHEDVATARTGAAPTPVSRGRWGWLAAAASFALVAIVSTVVMRSGAEAPDLTVAWVDGLLLETSAAATTPLAPGDVIGAGQAVRTARGARAGLTLPDGTVVELNERSEVRLRADGPSTVLDLQRGDVIVTAAKRHERTLQVRTDELTAAVKGTIFTVGHGLRGSRVSVLEGSVEVDGKLLEPGEQVTSRDELERAPLEDQVRWSRKSADYVKLIDELNKELLAAAAELEKNPLPPNVRHSSELLAAMPADTIAYVALPNSPDQIERLSDVLTRRLSANPTVAQWWQQVDRDARAHGAPSLSDMLDRVQRFSASLGDEIAIGLVLPAGPDAAVRGPMPVVVARVVDPDVFRAALSETLDSLDSKSADSPVQVLEASDLRTLAALDALDTGRIALVGEHVLAGPSAGLLADVADRLAGTAPSLLRGSPFLSSLDDHYRRGTEFLFGADLAGLVARVADGSPTDPAGARLLDPGNLDRLVVASSGDGDGRAVLSFQDSREGVASWLADPAPMGSLDFVSPDATAVLSVVFKDPAAMLAEVQSVVDSQSFTQGLADFRRELGLDLARDIAAPLGGELTIAIDGPLFPTPSWTLVAEVYDATHLQATITRLVERANVERAKDGLMPFLLSEGATSEGAAWTLEVTDLARRIAWTYRDSYLVVTPGLGGLEAALQAHRLGRTFTDSPSFLAVLPDGAESDVSFLLFQDFGATVSPLLSALEAGFGHLGGDAPSLPPPGTGTPGSSAFLAQGSATDREIAIEFHAGGNPLSRLLRQVVLHSLLQRAALADDGPGLSGLLGGAGSGYDAGSGSAD